MSSQPDLKRFGLDLGEELGRGATGIVYSARQLEVGNRAVAVKVFDPSLSQSVEALGREIEATSSLRHPNVVSVYDGNTASEPWFLVLELAEPEPPQLPIPLSSATSAGVKLASALAVAHDAGIVHGDVKPENILWHHGAEPLLGDFGTARVEARTRFRCDVGFTPLWSPPWIPELPADRASDVWSLAASLIWFHWQWEPPSIRWEQISPDLLDVFRAAMPDRPDPLLLGSEPAAEFGRRLQQCESGRGWATTPFPGGKHANWTPSDRSRATVPAAQLEEAPALAREAHGVSSQTVSSPADRESLSPAETAVGADRIPRPPNTKRVWLWRAIAGLLMLVVGGVVVFLITPMGDRLLGVADSSASDSGSEVDPGVEEEVTGPTADTSPAPPAVGAETTIAPEPGPSTGESATSSAQASFSSDLVSASDRNGQLDIFQHRIDGSVVAIVDRSIDDYAPSLSPDGTQVAFESNDGGSRAIYIVAVGGTSPPRRISPVASEAADPAWSPDGRSLAWASLAGGNWDIVVHDLDTGVELAVATSASDDRSPSWSPDGTHLAFRSDRSGNGDIYVLSIVDQSLRQVTDSPNEEDNPAISQGGVVAFERWIDGDVEVFTVASEADVAVRRTLRAGFDGSPAFDGDRLLFVERDGVESRILLDDGTSQFVLHSSAGLTQDLSSG